MADKYDAMIDAVASGGSGGDKYDAMIDAVAKSAAPAKTAGPLSSEPTSLIAKALGRYIESPQAGVDMQSAGKALFTNEPTQGFVNGAIRSIPQAIGGMAGGPLGAGAGEAIRQVGVGVTSKLGYTKPPTALDAFGRPLLAGTVQAVTDGIAAGAGFAAKKLAPAIFRNMAAIPEAAGQAVAEDPGLLNRAPSDAQVSGLYDAFHKASGTVSRKEFIAGQVDPVDTAERAMGDMKEIWAKGQSGQQLSAQDLVNASQAARVIRDAKASGNEFARGVSSSADQMKGVFDQILESMHPEWSAARQAAWENNVASEFSSPFPLNKNGSPNQLRGYVSLKGALAGAATGFGGAGAALATGHAGAAAAAAVGGTAALLSPFAESPAFYGEAIKAATSIPAGVYKIAQQSVNGTTTSLIQKYYMSPQASRP